MYASVKNLRSRLPEWIGGRLRAKQFRYKVSEIPQQVPAPSEPVRLYIGPANYAGQGYRFARAIESLPGIGAINMQRTSGNYGFPADCSVPKNVFWHSRVWQRRQLTYILENFTHVMYESEQPIFGGLFGRDVEAEVAVLRAGGLGVVMLSHGSDLRSPDIHRVRDKWSPFHDESPTVDRLREISDGNRALLNRLSAPVLVTTPDLLVDWPSASWIPVVVNPGDWENDASILERSRPIVLHAPTNPWIKGTDLVEPALNRLHDEGLIEYKRVAGVPANEMPELYRNADIIVEQFRIGTYSVTAVEALAAGRIAIAHIFPEVREHVESTMGLEVPVIEATIDNLEEVLRDICSDRDHYRAHSRLGPEFVRAVHDGRRSAKVLGELLG